MQKLVLPSSITSITICQLIVYMQLKISCRNEPLKFLNLETILMIC